MIGNLLNEGAVNVTLAVVDVGDVADPIVGAVDGPLVEPCAPRIGMVLFYTTLVLLIVGPAHT